MAKFDNWFLRPIQCFTPSKIEKAKGNGEIRQLIFETDSRLYLIKDWESKKSWNFECIGPEFRTASFWNNLFFDTECVRLNYAFMIFLLMGTSSLYAFGIEK